MDLKVDGELVGLISSGMLLQRVGVLTGKACWISAQTVGWPAEPWSRTSGHNPGRTVAENLKYILLRAQSGLKSQH